MRSLSEHQKQQVRETWVTIRDNIKAKYNLNPSQSPREILLTSKEITLTPLQPGAIKGRTIILNRELPDFENLLPYIIAKLCLQSALPTDLLCKECRDDLSFEYARQSIDDDHLREQWETIWTKHTPSKKISKIIFYHPCAAYKWLYSVAGSSGLDTLVQELTHRAKNQISVSFDNYIQYFTLRIRRFGNPLDDTEMKIIWALIDHPNMPANEMAQQIGISEEWLSKKVAQLEKRMILREFHRAPFSKIGIRLFHIIIGRMTSESDLYELFKNCPFLYSFRKVISGEHHALVTLAIPENPESMEYLRQGIKVIEKSGFTMESHLITNSGISHCFDYYSPKTGVWSIPWELLAIHLERIVHDNLASTIPKVYIPEKMTSMKLDDLDMKIVGCLREGISSVAKMRSELRVGQQRLVNHISALKKNGLMTKTWEAHNIGLTEYVIIYTKDKETGQAIAAWALRLPRAVISFSSKQELVLLVDLPCGGTYGLASALETVNGKTTVGILSSQIYGSWGFPSHIWDAKFQKWKCPTKELENWLSTLT